MKFSLFYEMQIADPTRKSEAQMFRDCLEQAELADKLGYHCIWEVEHHGLLEYSHSSAPEIFLSFVAARTKNVRIGHGITLLPHRYNHPIRVAERIATLDILSGGRVNWGSGKSSSLVEQLAFENDINTIHDQWLEAVEMIPQMWAKDVFEYKGRFFDIPPTQVVPKPVQEPHPPMFAACTKPESAAAVGRLGMGALNFAIGSDDYLHEKVAEYRAAVAKAKPVGRGVTNHFACTPPALILNDDKKACKYGYRGARFFSESLARYYLGGDRPTGKLPVSREFFSDEDLELAMERRNTEDDSINAMVGDPEFAKEYIQRFEEIGVDELIMVMQMGTVPHELVMESIKTFGEQVIPHFASSEPSTAVRGTSASASAE
jgi:alkanesulfonate monooxygenase SsuD/methylene tetrahydromethanopterin reductase-like flavin-dependent oxidoreductase (luciferase family)